VLYRAADSLELQSEGLVFINIDPQVFLREDEKLILGFIWTIILRYHIVRGDPGTASAGTGGEKKSVREDTLQWLAATTAASCPSFSVLREGYVLAGVVNSVGEERGLGTLVPINDSFHAVRSTSAKVSGMSLARCSRGLS
jgi:hypothetical protein